MSVYALATIAPSISFWTLSTTAGTQTMYRQAESWTWNKINEIGPLFGYHPTMLTKLVDTQEGVPANGQLRKSSQTHRSTFHWKGRPILVLPSVATSSFSETFITTKVNQRVEEIYRLATVAQSQPQSVYPALTNGRTYVQIELSDVCFSWPVWQAANCQRRTKAWTSACHNWSQQYQWHALKGNSLHF